MSRLSCLMVWLSINRRNIAILALSLFALWALALSQIRILILETESVPYRVCVQVYNLKPRKGDLCVAEVNQARLVKYLVGTEGDKIEHTEGDVRHGGDARLVKVVYVGGTRVGWAKATDRLSQIPEGIIPKGYVFLAGTHEDSLDSRYKEFGLIKASDIKGRAIPIWKTEESPED